MALSKPLPGVGWDGMGWAISLLRNPISLAWLEGYTGCGFTVGSPGLRGSSARSSDVQRGAARSSEAQQGASPPWHHWWCAARGALQGTEKERDISKHAWHSPRAWATRSVTSLCGFLHHLQSRLQLVPSQDPHLYPVLTFVVAHCTMSHSTAPCAKTLC